MERRVRRLSAIWKGGVEVRPLADKLVNREGELHQLGLPEEYLDNEVRLKHREDLTKQLTSSAQGLLSAIHDNAPFYPDPIRDAANEAHKATIKLIRKNLGAITESIKGNNIVRTREFYLESQAILLQLVREVDKVESLIRDRLAAVQVVNLPWFDPGLWLHADRLSTSMRCFSAVVLFAVGLGGPRKRIYRHQDRYPRCFDALLTA